MIGEQKNRDEGYVTVATKVPAHVADLLNIIAKAKGTDIYGVLQLFIQVIITAAKTTTALSPEMKLLLQMIDMDADWNKAFNFASPSAKLDIEQMILILRQRGAEGSTKKAREGYGLVMIDKPFLPGETPRQTLCIDEILERVTEVSMKGLYNQLRQIGVELESDSLRETLTIMCDAQHLFNISESDRQEMPQIGNFHDFGKAIEYGNKHKRKPHRTPDSLANSQQRIRFDEDDATTTDTPDLRPYGEKADAYFRDLEERAKAEEADLMEDEMGFRPIGSEW